MNSKLSKCCAIMYRTSFVIDKRGMLILDNSLLFGFVTKKVVRLLYGAKSLDHTSMLFFFKSTYFQSARYS